MKTGTRDASGASITTTATRNGFSVIVVSMDSKEPLNRFKVTRHLLDEVFKEIGRPSRWCAWKTPFKTLAPHPIRRWNGRNVWRGLRETLYCGRAKEQHSSQIKISFTPSDDVKTEDGSEGTPVKGQTVGTLNFEMPGENLGYVDGKDHGTVEALAASDVETSERRDRNHGAKGFIDQMVQKFKTFVVFGIKSKVSSHLKFLSRNFAKRFAFSLETCTILDKMIQYE